MPSVPRLRRRAGSSAGGDAPDPASPSRSRRRRRVPAPRGDDRRQPSGTERGLAGADGRSGADRRAPARRSARPGRRAPAARPAARPLPADRGAVLLDGVTKRHGTGDAAVVALDDVTVTFPAGTFTAIMGPSGSGKSTLLQTAAGLDRQDAGRVIVDGTVLDDLDEAARARLRRDRVGFVFQSFNLVPALTAEQNVALPFLLAGRRPPRGAVAAALAGVGLEDRAQHRPGELSGGQQQRVAIARALVLRPAVLFADEPTGALDRQAARRTLGMLRELRDRDGQTIVMVTHDPVPAATADRVLFFADGRVAGTLDRPTPAAVADRMTALEAPALAGVGA
nr:ABC transporter ATP-binding protein [Patulibacter sp. SYSU D01012]